MAHRGAGLGQLHEGVGGGADLKRDRQEPPEDLGGIALIEAGIFRAPGEGRISEQVLDQVAQGAEGGGIGEVQIVDQDRHRPGPGELQGGEAQALWELEAEGEGILPDAAGPRLPSDEGEGVIDVLPRQPQIGEELGPSAEDVGEGAEEAAVGGLALGLEDHHLLRHEGPFEFSEQAPFADARGAGEQRGAAGPRRLGLVEEGLEMRHLFLPAEHLGV